MGGRFMLSAESPVNEAVKRRMLAAAERDARLILSSIGDTTRVLDNALAQKILALQKAGATSAEDLIDLGGSPRWIAATERGDADGGAFSAGPSIALIDDMPPAAEIVRRIAEARDVLARRFAVGDRRLSAAE
jgi:nitronate monooxygenase